MNLDNNTVLTDFEQQLQLIFATTGEKYCSFIKESFVFFVSSFFGNDYNDGVAGAVGTVLQLDLLNSQPLVRHLKLNIQHFGTNSAAYQPLLDYITSASLESVCILGLEPNLFGPVSPRVSAPFLRAIQRNTKIQKLSIRLCCIYDYAWAEFLQNCSIDELEIDSCTFVNAQETSSMDSVAVAFRENRTINNLYFNLTEKMKAYALVLFSQLSHSRSLRRLSLEWSPLSFQPIGVESDYSVDIDTILAIGSLCSMSVSLRHIVLIDFEFKHRYIESFLTALDRNPKINSLTFQKCRWEDHSTSIDVTTYWLGRLRYIENLHVEFCIPDQQNRVRMNKWKRALRQNGALKEICMASSCSPHEEWIKRILRRNQGVQNFLKQFANPSLDDSTGPIIPTSLVPHILARVSECALGSTWIFNALSNGRVLAE